MISDGEFIQNLIINPHMIDSSYNTTNPDLSIAYPTSKQSIVFPTSNRQWEEQPAGQDFSLTCRKCGTASMDMIGLRSIYQDVGWDVPCGRCHQDPVACAIAEREKGSGAAIQSIK